MTDATPRPRRPAKSQGVTALLMLGSGLAIAMLVAVTALWRYDRQMARRLEAYRRQHPEVVIPTDPPPPTHP